jgi:hypothetical protein
LAIIHTVCSEEDKSTLIEMARVWTRLANEQDARSPDKGDDEE